MASNKRGIEPATSRKRGDFLKFEAVTSRLECCIQQADNRMGIENFDSSKPGSHKTTTKN
jgi:hypothetical protein